ncbi:tandem-95 repeat protein [Nocardioides carbamazepini]|uniref:Ig-like domain-containing protein n=1 Tax=Nocardioides carbamazepini TaxID=2854259 RepID=UPI002149BDBD|nr:Ig-like domain-containing protein [Nocardioides carbamazepini]MCR1786054.1 tandem-95 repeat protein [Nocardioides carbamazepini]
MKLPRIALSAALAVSGALVITGLGTTLAPAAQAATVGCDTLAAAGYRQSTVATGLTTPRGIDVAADGVVYVGNGDQVDKLTPSGGTYTRTTADGTYAPYALAVGTDGTIYVADQPNGNVEKFIASGGAYTAENVTWGLGGELGALDVDPSGTVFVGDTAHQRITKLTPGGGGYTASGVQSLPLPTQVHGISVAGNTLFFTMGDTVRALNIPGNTQGAPLPTNGLSSPGGLDLDPSGATPPIVVADTGNDRLVRVGAALEDQTTLPTDGLDQPQDVAVDTAGNVYVADTGNGRVVKLTPVSVDAVADTATTTSGDTVTTDVLANDSAEGADLAEPTIAKNPAHGSATVNPNGTITYTPDAGFSGTDSYRYAVRDSADPASVCATATVTVTVGQDNACGPVGTTGALTRLPIETGTDYPTYFDIDADGGIFVTDSENGEIVKLTPSGSGYTRSVVAPGIGNVSAIALDDSDGTLWVVRYPGEVLELTPSGSTYTVANTYSGGLLNGLGGIDVAANGDVYVSINATSFGGGGVVRMSGPGMAQTQVIGGLDVPHQVTVDDAGAVYVASYTRVVKLDGTTQTDAVTGLGSGQGVAVDSTGTLWISTTEDPGVWTAAPSGAGYAPKQRYAPWGANHAYNLVVTDDDAVFVADFEKLWEFGPLTVDAQDDTATVGANGSVTTDVRANDATDSVLDDISVVGAPAHGAATVNDDHTITYRPTPGFSGTDHYDYQALDEDGLVCAVARVTVTVTTSDGCGDIPSKEYGYDIVVSDDDFTEPAGVAVDPRNFIFISDAAGAQVNAWAPGAGPSPIDGGQDLDPQGIAADAQGNVYYADEGEHEIVKLTWSEDDNGYPTRTVLAGNLQRPAGVAVDADGNVFFAERGSGHVHRLTPSGGAYTSSVVASGLDSPRGVAVDADGNLFVVDRGNGRVVRLTPSGPDYALSVVSTSLSEPIGVTVRPDGAVLVADTGNRRVLQLTPNGSGYAQTVAQRWDARTPTWIVAPDNDRLIVSDPANDDILMMVTVGITAEDDTATTTLQTPVTTDVHANDTGIDGVEAVTTVSVQPDGGTASIGPDGRITYTPQAGFSGTDRYVYQTRVTMEGSAEFIGITAFFHIDVCDSAEVTVTVPNVFTAGPGVTTPQNEPVTTPLAGIASTQGKPLDPTAVTQVQEPDHGSLSIDATSGAVTYTPDDGYSGGDSYRVLVCDTADPVECAEITVAVTVEANTVTAVDDTASTDVVTPVSTDVTGNDVSASGQAFDDPTVTSGPEHGTTSVGSGGITYTPAIGFSGKDSYDYEACDTSTPTPVCDTGTVTVTVRNGFLPGPDVQTPQNTPLITPLHGHVTTSGRPLDPESVTSVTAPGHGVITIDPATGAVTYSPASGYSGADSYTIKVCDTSAPVQCADLMMGVTVGANTVTAGDDSASTTVGTAVATDVTADDTSASGQALGDPTVSSDPAHGTTSVTGGVITYTPDAGFSGEDAYTYEVCDSSHPTPVCDTATVTATVDNVFTTGATITTPYNTPVTTGLDDYATTTGMPLAPAATTTVTTPDHGTLAIDPTTGAITYSPTPGFSGADDYTVQVCDTSAPVQCTDATVEVTVQAKPAPTSGPALTVHAPDKATLKVTRTGNVKPVTLTASVTITGLSPATRVVSKTITGTATLYGPAKKAGPGMCTPANAVATVPFAPVNGTTALPPVAVTRPGHYTWVATTSADGDNTASTQSCGSPDSTTLVHRPSLPAKVTVKTGYTGVVADPSVHGRRIRPVKVSIPGIGLNARLETVGIRKRDMVIPTDTARGGWLAGSAAPGESVGSTVIAGHVSDRGDRPGAFGKLRRARPGQIITVRTADGTRLRYRIETITTQPRARGLSGTATSTTGAHQLTLVTCTGRVTYRNGRFHYTKNLVVTATPIG